MIFNGGPPQAWASVWACRLGDALSQSVAVALRAEYADGELVDAQVHRLRRWPGSAVRTTLADIRKLEGLERQWQDKQARVPGGVGGMLDLTRFPGAIQFWSDDKSRAAVATVTAAGDDRRDGPQWLLSHSLLVSGLRVQLSRGRVHVDPAISEQVEEGLAALTMRPPPPAVERVPVTDTDGPADIGLCLALAIRHAARERPLGPNEEYQLKDRTRYAQRNFRLI